ncbi:MAG: YebC/PmpR family DNA-binding transcriptional regulator [Thermoguttaceae bacterium]|nr:YebC/PmpR family DNA-binding transcriptional regulator [Thermoguttaceae bacterium]
MVDAKRGKLWSRLSKAIIIAAKMGGGDPDMNVRLRTAIDDAKAVSMPKENITRAIKRGTGELAGVTYESVTYEGYGAGGVAVLCEVLTDNRNRTAPDIKKLFEVSDCKLGAAGCVAWMFEKKGLFLIPIGKVDEDRLMEIALEAGADDVSPSGQNFEITCRPESYQAVKEALAAAGIEPEVAELSLIPKNTVDIEDAETARKVLKLMERLDDHDDVQSVSANFNIPDSIMAEIGSEA